MSNLKAKTSATLIALFLVLTIAFTFVALPVANAHTPAWTIPSWCYIAVAPETIGVNQQALIVFWTNVYPATAAGAYGDRFKFTVDVTKPDGSKETLGPFTSDPVGGSYTSYTPTEVGTYSFVAKFPGHTYTGLPAHPTGIYNAAYVNDTITASTSEPVQLTVQQEQVPTYQETPLPAGYWTRPIYGANRGWWQIAGNWLAGAAQTDGPTTSFAYGEGPESPHILWTRSYWSGGIMDARISNFLCYYSGLSYESFGSPSIILEGRMYYPISGGSRPSYGWYCVDLYTGDTMYYENNTLETTAMPSFASVYNYESPNQHGGMPYLWRTSGIGSNTWEMLDGFTGKAISRIANVSSGGTAVYGKDGSILRYNIVNLGNTTVPKYYLTVWNTSHAMWWRGTYEQFKKNDLAGFGSGNNWWLWRPYTSPYLFDGRCGFSLNTSIPAVQGSIQAVREDQYVIGGTAGKNNGTYVLQGNLWALNLKPDSNGKITPTLLWNITFTPPQDAIPDVYSPGLFTGKVSLGSVDPEDGVFTFSEAVTRKRWVYSLATGQLMWESAPEPQFNFYGMSANIYKGILFGYGQSGVLIAYNITTGKILWNWSAPFEGLGESYWQHTPLSLGCIADGKLYMYSSEHSPTMPLRRDANIWCIDAETGELMWKMQAWPQGMKIADGRMVYLDLFDNAIYCLGKGPSATTISAPQTVPTLGSSVMITGTVTDQSPSGRHTSTGSLDFTLKGTPAISDADMEAWMEYMFEQRPMPAEAKGVEVAVDTIDPNGNFVHVGTATSDITGTYGLMFTPEVPGQYQIIATFAGTAAYGPSFAQTYMGVVDAPPATSAPEYPQPIDNTMTIIGVGIAIMILVAIFGVLILRKK